MYVSISVLCVCSAIYNAPVQVRVKRCEKIRNHVFSREVDLVVGEQVWVRVLLCVWCGKCVVYGTS
ncbi:hypothetical protein EON63_11460 [archaeon]|nr:MAG: hypothetical protein EON63_11460 [archaeon]